MNNKGLVLAILLLTGLALGCARKPATTSSAPAPTGAATTSRAMNVAPAGSGTRPASATTPTNPGRSTSAATARPAPSEFLPVAELRDVHFDFDKYAIRPDDAAILDKNAGWLKAHANDLLLIEGHCDERGTNEYNVALGERRAQATLNYLVAQGVATRRITIVSYGEERPQCADHTEDCWAKNRRAHFLVKPQ
jgi:peptidoglycan-associated lipoprotein